MSNAESLAYVVGVYEGSSGDATKALYERLGGLGPAGTIALNLFRAQKNSARAKVYRRRYKHAAYDRKQWAMGNLAQALCDHADALNIRWGWGEDPAQEYHRVVLYLDLPTGQVSFHTDVRGDGPDYPGEWDGVRGQSAARICAWTARVLAHESAPA
jgi:hypothetical protein